MFYRPACFTDKQSAEYKKTAHSMQHRLQKFPTNMELFSVRIAALFLILPTVLFARPLSTQAILRNELLKQLLQARASAIREGQVWVSNRGVQNERKENEMLLLQHFLRNEAENKDTATQSREHYGMDNHEGNPLENPYLFEGDIMAEKEDIDLLYGQSTIGDDYANIEKIHNKGKWDNGIVYYEFDDGYTEEQKEIILGAMKEYEEKTCVRFEEATKGIRLNITINLKTGCWSYIGKLKRVQPVSLGKYCVYHGTVLHELGHALGFWHEQTRPDRDRYITVHRENIIEGKEHNFNVARLVNYHGEPYNYGSIMHYVPKQFSKNGEDTITVSDQVIYELEDKPKIGRGKTLTTSDVNQINKFYGCYVPNTGPGALHIKVVEAGPFQEPGNYYVCVRAIDSKDNRRQQCSKKDEISTTDPQWDTTLKFEQIEPDAKFYSFEIWIRSFIRGARDPWVVPKQTIWVENKEKNDQFCTTKGLCVNYRYELVTE